MSIVWTKYLVYIVRSSTNAMLLAWGRERENWTLWLGSTSRVELGGRWVSFGALCQVWNWKNGSWKHRLENWFITFIKSKSQTRIHHGSSRSIKSPSRSINVYKDPSRSIRSIKVHQGPSSSVKVYRGSSRSFKVHQGPSRSSRSIRSIKVH